MSKQTPFYEEHLKANAKMVDFAGWDMPLHYGSQIQEHHQVRSEAGLFDVSHMGIVDLEGSEGEAYLRHLLANDVSRLTIGKALYTCMLNETGGILDDLIVYKLSPTQFRLVINAGTREKDLAWIFSKANAFAVQIKERTDLVMLALQGPKIHATLNQLIPSEYLEAVKSLKPFHFFFKDSFFIARTGYTGEDGYEWIFPAKDAIPIWQQCLKAGIKPCGLGARDTLRLEAGLNLYGADMDETVTPLESNLAWTVAFDPNDRQFIGRDALELQRQQGVKRQLVGLILEGPGIIRNHQKVMIEANGTGEVTSGGYSPTLEKSIALARIPQHDATECYVEIRNKSVAAKIIKPPFIKREKKI